MKPTSLLAAGFSVLLAQSAFAQPAPALPAQPEAAPSNSPQPSGAYPQGAYPQGAYPQGAYAPPPAWGVLPSGQMVALGRPAALPLEMPYEPDAGVPAGYKVAEKKRSGLIIAGAVTLGGLWVASALVGGIMEDANNGCYSYGYCEEKHAWPLWIPVIGPLITIGTVHSDSAGTTPLLLDGLFQAGALTMLIAGLAAPEKVLKYQFPTTAGLTLKPIVTPVDHGGFAGLSGSF